MINENGDELYREIRERETDTLKLFETAKKIQQQIVKLPFADRQAAMNEVVALETAALVESEKVSGLRAEQAAKQREEVSRQKAIYL